MPASLDDNTLMTAAQRAEYKGWLAGLPEAERKMLMDGDWDYIPGAAFAELHNRIHGYDPVPLPEYARVIRGFDYGFGKPFSVGWYWADYDGRLWKFASWYGWNGKADVGIRMAVSQVAKGIREREVKMGFADRIEDSIADPSIFNRTPNIHGGGQGPSIAEVMAEYDVHFNPGDNDRLLGKQQMHERLRVPEEENELPMLMISRACDNFWRTVPSLALDEKNVEDVDTDQEDHEYDETRYVLMSRPITPAREKVPRTPVEKITDIVINGVGA